MKTYQTNKIQSVHLLCSKLQAELPLKFDGKMAMLTRMSIKQTDHTIEIGLPAPYTDYLYKVHIDGTDIEVSKSEHYTDDVNSLAMEDVLTDTIIEFVGKENIENLVPSSN
jgi:hypothetical protein